MGNMQGLNELSAWVRKSVSLKLFVIGFLMLVLLIPATMIQSTIHEREYRREAAIQEIASKWGGAQTVTGPWLTIPYRTYYKNDKGVLLSQIQSAYFLPETLEIKGQVNPEIRYRGIYEAVLYRTTLRIEGNFPVPDFSAWNVAPEDVLWSDAQLAYGITDMKGIRVLEHVHWNKKNLIWNPGIAKPGVADSGVSVRLPADTASHSAVFAMDLELNGSQALQFMPFGKTTTVALQSSWASPSFQGGFLPEERSINADGFKAAWKVLHLNRNYPQAWSQATLVQLEPSAFGVSLRIPADQYQKTSRSIKYAVLFILLTFGSLFLIELKRRQNVHVMQYLLVGLALVLFYSLLLSLVEHLGFVKAYMVAGLAIVSMISLYAKGIFQDNSVSLGIALLMIVLYGYLYTLLQMEDYSLLIGNVGLLVALSAAMYFSRRTAWLQPPE